MGLVISSSPTHAQPIPTQNNWQVGVGDGFALFFPAEWELTIDPLELILTDSRSETTIRASAVTHERQNFEQVPFTTFDYPESTRITSEIYGGAAAWLFQWTQDDVYRVVAIIEYTPTSSIYLVADFPTTKLGTVAPLITQIFEQILLLPITLSVDTETFTIMVPDVWYRLNLLVDTTPTLYTAPEESDVIAMANGNVPKTWAVQVQYAVNTTLDTILQTNTSLEVDRRQVTINGATITQIYREDATLSLYEVIFLQQRNNDAFVVMRLWLAEPLSIDDSAFFNAIFGSIRLQ